MKPIVSKMLGFRALVVPRGDEADVYVVNAALLMAAWKDPSGMEIVREGIASKYPATLEAIRQKKAALSWDFDAKLRGIATLIAAGDPSVLEIAGTNLGRGTSEYRGKILAASAAWMTPKSRKSS